MSIPLARSLLFLPGNREKFLDKAVELDADAFVVDLEDSVPEAEKDRARDLLMRHAPRLAAHKPLWVRVNAPEHRDFDKDIAAIVGVPDIRGLMIPKVDSVAAVRRLDEALAARETSAAGRGSLRLLLTIESARAVWSAFDLACASERVESICFAGARDGDLMADIGCDWSGDGQALLHARRHTLLAARAARCTFPLDGVFADLHDLDGFERDTRLSRSLGFRGRPVIHPSQIEPANRLYSPTQEELDASRRLVEAFDAAVARGLASTTFEGRMIDVAMAAAARSLIERARAPGGAPKRERG